MKRPVIILFLAGFVIFWSQYASAQRKYSFDFYVEEGGFNISQAESGTDVLLRYLEAFPNKAKISRPREDLSVRNVIVDEYGMTHITLNQLYKGVVVHTGTVKVHFDKKGGLNNIHGKFYYDMDMDVSATIDSASAEQIALADAQKNKDATIINNENVTTKLIIYPLRLINPPDSGKYALVWTVYIVEKTAGGSWKYLIDAKNSQIVYKFDENKYSNENLKNGDSEIKSDPDTNTSSPTKKSSVETLPQKKARRPTLSQRMCSIIIFPAWGQAGSTAACRSVLSAVIRHPLLEERAGVRS